MAAPAYMLSLLGRQRALLGAEFFTRYNSDWLIWEPGPWRPARTMASSNTESTHQPSSKAPARPEGEDALCFELKRVVGGAKLTVGRATENDIVINDLTVSREQLTLQYADKKWSVVGGEVLKNGTVLTAGDVKLTFYDAEGFPARLEAESKKRK
jgi:hypothetical protein